MRSAADDRTTTLDFNLQTIEGCMETGFLKKSCMKKLEH
jgi:hypothetical protein